MATMNLTACELVSNWQRAACQLLLPNRLDAISRRMLLSTAEALSKIPLSAPELSEGDTLIGTCSGQAQIHPADDARVWLRELVAHASSLRERLHATWLVTRHPC